MKTAAKDLLGEPDLYSRHFKNILQWRAIEDAKTSIQRIAKLYEYFERLGDRAGQHHCEVMALTGRNRARFAGLKEQAGIFEAWLFNHDKEQSK